MVLGPNDRGPKELAVSFNMYLNLFYVISAKSCNLGPTVGQKQSILKCTVYFFQHTISVKSRNRAQAFVSRKSLWRGSRNR